MAWAVVGAGIGFAAFVSGHVVLFRLRPVRFRSRAIFALFTATTAAVAAVVLADAGPVTALHGTALMVSGFLLYMPLYYAVDNSVSVRTMLELEAAPEGLTRDELVRRYSLEWMVARRLATMTENGYLTMERDGSFAPTPRGCLVARLFDAVKAIGNLGPGG